jgi:hypothetical protein
VRNGADAALKHEVFSLKHSFLSLLEPRVWRILSKHQFNVWYVLVLVLSIFVLEEHINLCITLAGEEARFASAAAGGSAVAVDIAKLEEDVQKAVRHQRHGAHSHKSACYYTCYTACCYTYLRSDSCLVFLRNFQQRRSGIWLFICCGCSTP